MYTKSCIFASSRGRSMSRVNCNFNIIPGGTYGQLCDLAEKQLRNSDRPKIVYFVAGIPDICTLVRNKSERYEESFLDMEKDHIVHIQNTISGVEKRMKDIGCKVVFATISTVSFQAWNNHRKSIGKTIHLKYEDLYSAMQEKLNFILHVVNRYIIETNLGNGMLSPFLHSFVHKRNGKKIRYIYSQLIDGVHPNRNLAAAWTRHMRATIDKNEHKIVL